MMAGQVNFNTFLLAAYLAVNAFVAMKVVSQSDRLSVVETKVDYLIHAVAK